MLKPGEATNLVFADGNVIFGIVVSMPANDAGKLIMGGFYLDATTKVVEFGKLEITKTTKTFTKSTPDAITSAFGDGAKTSTQSRAITDDEFNMIGTALFGNDDDTTTQSRALTDAEFAEIEKLVAAGGAGVDTTGAKDGDVLTYNDTTKKAE